MPRSDVQGDSTLCHLSHDACDVPTTTPLPLRRMDRINHGKMPVKTLPSFAGGKKEATEGVLFLLLLE